MAKSSYGPRQATTWPVTQKQKPTPRIVRLGRPANDNYRQPNRLARAIVLGIGAVVLGLILVEWRYF